MDICLDVKTEKYHVTVLNDIFFTFKPEFAGFFGGSHRTILIEIIEFNNLGPDETTFKICMNNTSRFGGGPTPVDRPGPDLLLVHREISDQAQSIKALTDNLI